MKPKTVSINEHPLTPGRVYVADYGSHLMTFNGEADLRSHLDRSPVKPKDIWEITTRKYEG